MHDVHWVWAAPPDDTLRRLARDLAAGTTPAGGERLRHKRPRTVWRLPSVAGGVVLKHYRPSRTESWRTLVLPGQAEREYRVMEDFCRRGVPTVQPLGFGERRRGGRVTEAWFLSQLVPDAAPLDERLEALRSVGDGEAWRALADEAFVLLADLHGQPCFHRDMHAGNVLADGAGRLLVIDLHAVWLVPRTTRGMRLENLARFLFSLRGSVDLDLDLPRFVALYAARRGEALDALLPAVRRRLASFESDYVRGRSARAMRDSTEFVGERDGRDRLRRRREYPRTQLALDLDEHAVHVAARDGKLLGDAPASCVSHVGEGTGRVVKEYRRRGPLAPWRVRLGLGRARGAWRSARRCFVTRVPTPLALALLEHPDGRAFLVTERHPGRSLERLAAELPQGGPQQSRGALARAVGHVVGRLSRAGLRHDDLSTKNLLVGPAPPADTGDLRCRPAPEWPDVALVDLDNMRTTAAHDRAALARMLGQLGDLPETVTATDRRRFLLGFRAAAGRDPPPAVLAEARRFTRARQQRRAALEARLDRPSGAR